MQPEIDAVIRERILTFLIPLFLMPANGDANRARQAVEALLASYNPRTARELRLAALAIAFSLGALDALSKSAGQDATLNQVLRLRSSANTLARNAEKAEIALQAERQEPSEDQNVSLPESTDTQALVDFARAMPPLSRQQRRHAERLAEKLRRQQENQARQAERQARKAA
jgi:hypothetical protein